MFSCSPQLKELADQAEQSSLLRLPKEIRLQIFELYIGKPKEIVFGDWGLNTQGLFLCEYDSEFPEPLVPFFDKKMPLWGFEAPFSLHGQQLSTTRSLRFESESSEQSSSADKAGYSSIMSQNYLTR